MKGDITMSDNNYVNDRKPMALRLAKFIALMGALMSGLNLLAILAGYYMPFDMPVELAMYRRFGITYDTYELISVAAFALFSFILYAVNVYEDEARQ